MHTRARSVQEASLIPLDLAEQVVGVLHQITGGKVNFMGVGGTIVASAQPERVGTIHEGGQKIMAGEVDEIAITEEMAKSMMGALPGYNGVVRFEGKKVGCIGLGGDPDYVKPLQRMATVIVVEELKRRAEEDNRATTIHRFADQIQDIADRMSVISLNGSIQAARLGAQGAPFQVVASQMRKLAAEVIQIIDAMETETRRKQKSSTKQSITVTV